MIPVDEIEIDGRKYVLKTEDTEEGEVQYRKNYELSGNSILNKKGFHATAAIAHTADYNSYIIYDKNTKKVIRGGATVSAELTISDCNRSIHLIFDAYKKETLANAVEKLETLVNAISEFKNHFILMVNESEEFTKMLEEKFGYVKDDSEDDEKHFSDFDEFVKNIS